MHPAELSESWFDSILRISLTQVFAFLASYPIVVATALPSHKSGQQITTGDAAFAADCHNILSIHGGAEYTCPWREGTDEYSLRHHLKSAAGLAEKLLKLQ